MARLSLRMVQISPFADWFHINDSPVKYKEGEDFEGCL